VITRTSSTNQSVKKKNARLIIVSPPWYGDIQDKQILWALGKKGSYQTTTTQNKFTWQ